MNIADIINPDIPVPGTLTKWGYRYMTEQEYRSFPAINNSLLKCRTLSEMYLMLNTPQKQSEALALGTMADIAILTPEESWLDRFCVADIPINPRTGRAYGMDTKKAEEAMAEAVSLNPGKFACSVDDYKELSGELKEIKRAFFNHNLCAEAVKNSLKQVSGIMWHPQFNCWVKWKPDNIPLSADPEHGWSIDDLKTTRRHVMQFDKDCMEFDYHGQAGWYAHNHETLLAMNRIPIRLSNFNFLVVGKPDRDGRSPRNAMALKVRVPLSPLANDNMVKFHRRVFPEDGFGIVQKFLAALDEHISTNPDPEDRDAIDSIWTAYENDSEPFVLCRPPRS